MNAKKLEVTREELGVKKSLLSTLFSLLFVLLLVLAACQVEPEKEGGHLIEASLPLDTNAAALDLSKGRYYSLSTGAEVTSPSGGNWDIALESHGGAFFILTNSGATAVETAAWTGAVQSGQGRVWYTGSTDFDAVSAASQAVIPAVDSEYAPYTEDAERWVTAMAADPVRQFLNVMTYAGYPTGSGVYPPTGDGSGLSPENCFKRYDVGSGGMSASYSPYLFNKKEAYYMGGGMPPSYSPTKRVYIVRHGDGVKHSKVQLSEVYREAGIGNNPSLFVLQLRYEVVE
jgi:hypothetical protein